MVEADTTGGMWLRFAPTARMMNARASSSVAAVEGGCWWVLAPMLPGVWLGRWVLAWEAPKG